MTDYEHEIDGSQNSSPDRPTGVEVFQIPTGTYETRGSFAIRGGSYRERRQFAATAVLIRHPRGDFLIDAGFGVEAAAHIASLPALRHSPHRVGTPVSEQLAEAGYDAARLTGILVTHSHWDHVSGIDSLAAPVWLTVEEERYAQRARADTVFRRVIQGHATHRYGFDDPGYLGFPSSHDVHGDGSLVVVPARGHTSGSVVVFANPAAGPRYAFIGDLTWQLEGVTQRRERPLMMRILADSDPAQIRDDVERIRALPEDYRIVPAHDVEAYDGIPRLSARALSGRP